MLPSLARRVFLFFSLVFLTGFALILIHALHSGTEVFSAALAVGAIAAAIVVVWNWLALMKTDDYLIPSHARLFFIVTAALVGLAGFALLGYFLFSDRYPGSYRLYFGVAPAGLAVAYIALAAIKAKEAFVLPPAYRPAARSALWDTAPLILSVPAIAVTAGCLLLAVARGVQIESQAETAPAERTPVREIVEAPSGPERAEELFRLARERQEENRYRHTYDLFQQAAALDHPEADYELGLIYSGSGYLRNLTRAYGHFNVAREKGHVEAAFRLGRAYRHGELGLEPDFAKAHQYLEQAASAGHMDAQTQLAHMYNRGEGRAIDFERAFYWFKQAAEQGDPVAQNDVGIFYMNGTGVERDLEEGVRWLTKAADQGVTVAAYNMGHILYEGIVVPKNYERAFAYFEFLAEKNVPFGFQMVGQHYFYGKGVEQDYAAAVQAFSSGASRGNVPSRYYLGYCYLHGLGTDRNSTAALNHLEAAARADHTDAQLLVGRLYLEGRVVLEDRPGAAKWFHAAAENGSREAAEELAALKPTLTEDELAEVAIR